LGRTTNYIENFYIGIAKSESWSKLWTPLIPNSQVYLFPAGIKTDKWKIEVYVNPTSALSLIIGITVIIIVSLLIVVAVLHYKEKQEDKVE
jgi:integrin alpha FG-GAP repeat containing protein 1